MRAEPELMVEIERAIAAQGEAARVGDMVGYAEAIQVEAEMLARLVLVYWHGIECRGSN
jgi:hypothetical protein